MSPRHARPDELVEAPPARVEVRPPRHAAPPAPEPPPARAPETPEPHGPALRRTRATRSQELLAARARAREQRRRRLRTAVVVAVVVATVSGAVGFAWSRHRATGQATTAAAGRTQRTLLVQIRGADGSAASSVLIAADPRTRQSAVVLIPNRVVAEVPGNGTQPYGQALGQPDGPALSRSALADLVGVTVDASWVLDRSAFAGLVDRLGGIRVDVDVDIVARRGDSSVVVVPRGAGQRLTGAQALAVLDFRAAGEDQLQALPRLQHVLVALLAKLPPRSKTLGAGAQISNAGVATAVLDGARGDIAGDRASYQILPVLPIDGGGPAAYRIDVTGVVALAGGALVGSRLPGHTDTGNRVLVLNQAGGVGLGQQVRDRIVPRGFIFVDSRNQTPFDRKQTVVVVSDTTAPTRARASRLAAALGLPDAPVQVSPRAQNIADLIVVVGTDFRP